MTAGSLARRSRDVDDAETGAIGDQTEDEQYIEAIIIQDIKEPVYRFCLRVFIDPRKNQIARELDVPRARGRRHLPFADLTDSVDHRAERCFIDRERLLAF